ncbi:protealysin inhibitor emfourin [Microlunatus elymi]|nr:protealysin inhibitor emfourin [Microlunatus elymi]
MSCHFIPTYLLQHIIDNTADDDHHAALCRSTLQIDDRVRQRRRLVDHGPAADADDARRTVYTAANTEDLPGTVARKEDDPPAGDAAVDEAWASSGQIWDLFADVCQRQSVDGRDTPIKITVHYGRDYDNAFWDGQQLVFGDGDGVIFTRFTKPMDVMAHEFTHGVTQYTAALTYQGQSGALNESISDAFAAICKQWVNGQTAEQADWLIGEGLFMPGVQAKALRSMKDPGTAYDDPRLGKDPQVGSMADYDNTTDDNGGVHINSGIPNRAFYLTATALGGHSWDQAGPVWYRALTGSEVGADTDFAGFANATVEAARQLYPDHADVADKVRQAWATVGVLDADTAPAAAGSGGAVGAAVPTVAIRRSGGITGVSRSATIDADSERGRRLSALLDQTDFSRLASSPPRPDRFVYTVQYAGQEITVGEQDLPSGLSAAFRTALDES